jgi:endonuclease-3
MAMDDSLKITWIADRLIDFFGAPAMQLLDPIENLVLTILSQNTNDINRDRAFESLMRRFGTLEGVRTAALKDIASSIQIGGLQQQKARSIRAALNRVMGAKGSLELALLKDLPLPDAVNWMQGLPGVGPKTAGIVLLFSFDRPVFPADTHIRRVMSRMGLVPERGDPHPRLNELLPADAQLMQRLHLLTIRLGREVCHPRRPECERCPLRSKCVWMQAHGLAGKDEVTSSIDKGGTHR